MVLYPFVMMDMPAGNALPDPTAAAGQPAYPWRGRITCHPAPALPDRRTEQLRRRRSRIGSQGRPQPLVELRTADGAGLEDMFLELTADTSREGAAA